MSGYAQLPDPEKLPPPRAVTKKKTESERIASFVTGIGHQVNPELGERLKQCEPALKAVIKVIVIVAPMYQKLYVTAYEIYVKLPYNIIVMIFGIALCFFGGTYVASIAAIEAFRQLGWEKVKEEIIVVYEQTQLVLAASKKDDEVDADNDGVADVDQMAATELAQRKLTVAMKAISEPDRLQRASGALFASYLAVLATLRLEFARTTAFALGIVEMAKFPIIRFALPIVTSVLGEDLAHWGKTLVEATITFIAVFFAWFLQMIISAFYSGLRGGRMFADGLIAFLTEKELMHKVPFIQQPFDPDESFLDEAIGYSLAAVGFCFQLFNGFNLPFPFNIIFLPLTIIEWFLRIQISFESTAI
jgi:hypothetical protein